jgi:hypothetical protein
MYLLGSWNNGLALSIYTVQLLTQSLNGLTAYS